MPKENIIISLGGSVVAPEGLDLALVKAFRGVVKKHLQGQRFFIFVGGGKICRDYQGALREFGADTAERDWMGIHVSRLNAEVVRQAFGDAAFAEVLHDPTKKVNSRRDVVLFGGWKPGWSTDYCAVMLAKNMGIKTIANLTNIDYVYDKDPRRHKNAKAFKEIPWKDFKGLAGGRWTPGLSVPFDPRASKIAEVLKIKVAVMNGVKLDRLEQFLRGKPFIGTTIQ